MRRACHLTCQCARAAALGMRRRKACSSIGSDNILPKAFRLLARTGEGERGSSQWPIFLTVTATLQPSARFVSAGRARLGDLSTTISKLWRFSLEMPCAVAAVELHRGSDISRGTKSRQIRHRWRLGKCGPMKCLHCRLGNSPANARATSAIMK